MRIMRKIAAMSAIPAAMIGMYGLGRASVVAAPVETTTVHATALKCGEEDSRNWNAALCGNRSMGVQVDVTPNKPGGKVWVTLKFTGPGVNKGTFARQTWR